MEKISIYNLLTNKHDVFFYLACLLVTFEIFPFHEYGLGSGKSLSTIPCVLYIVQLLIEHNFSLPKNCKTEFLCILALLLVSLFRGFFVYDDLVGISTSLSMWGSYAIYIVCFHSFIKDANKHKIVNMFRCILCSFKISLLFGILELIYFNIKTLSFIRSFILLFVRDEMYIDGGRLQFNFGEAGSGGVLIVGLFSLTIYSLIKLGYKFTRYDKIEIILIYVIEGLFAMSVTFWATFLLFLLSYFFSSKRRVSYKVMFIAGVLFLTMVSSLSLISNSVVYSRIEKLTRFQNSNSFDGENSSATRFALWYISYEMFRDNYLLGVGWGNFAMEYPKYYKSLPMYLNTQEMTNKLSSKTHQSYSIFSTALVEGGVLGIFWLFLFYRRLWPNNRYRKIFVPIYLIFCFQIIIIYKFESLLIALILSDKKINRYIEGPNYKQFVTKMLK